MYWSLSPDIGAVFTLAQTGSSTSIRAHVMHWNWADSWIQVKLCLESDQWAGERRGESLLFKHSVYETMYQDTTQSISNARKRLCQVREDLVTHLLRSFRAPEHLVTCDLVHCSLKVPFVVQGRCDFLLSPMATTTSTSSRVKADDFWTTYTDNVKRTCSQPLRRRLASDLLTQRMSTSDSPRRPLVSDGSRCKL